MYLVNLVLILSIALLWPCHAIAKMYKWADEKGQIHWSDTPPTPEENARDIEEHETVEDKQKEKDLRDNRSGRPISTERRYGRKNELFPD